MNLKDLLWQVKFGDVKESLLKLYENQKDQIDAYNSVFKKLLMTIPKKYDNKDYTLDINWIEPTNTEIDDEGYWDLSIIGEDKISYSFSLTPWSNWLELIINENVFNKMSKEDVVAHCLWEITFYGFTEDKQKEILKELTITMEEINKDIEAGKNYMSYEEFEKKIKEEGLIDDDE